MREKSKKNAVRWIVIFSLLLWILVFFYVVHIICVLEADVGLSPIDGLSKAVDDMFLHPLRIFPFPVKAVYIMLALTLLTAFFIWVGFCNAKMKKHYDKETALGDAHFLTPKEIEDYNYKYVTPCKSKDIVMEKNMILADGFYQSMDNEASGRNANVICIAGSGRGKTWRFVTPNLINQAGWCSFVVTDPSGSIYRSCGSFFEHMGYRIKCLNLSHMELSDHFNPFNYIRPENSGGEMDITLLVDTLITNTTPPTSKSNDPFWEKAEAAFFNATFSLVAFHLEEEKRNLSTILDLIRMADVPEEGSNTDPDAVRNPLDAIFKKVEQERPESFAVKQYGTFKIAAGRTAKSILVSAAFRIKAFDLMDVKRLTNDDTLELDSVGDEKTVLFMILPTGNLTFNFLSSLCYSILFTRLYDYCENSAMFSRVVRDGSGQVVRTFRAANAKEGEKTQEIADKFVEDLKTLTEKNIRVNNKCRWYEVWLDSGEYVGYRKTREEVQEFINVLKNSSVEKNGEHLPIHTRFMLDEFSNIGRIDSFETKISTVRKYDLSTTIIVQSLTSLQSIYKDTWGILTSNSDNILFMGGGADKETTEWFSELIGKETRHVMGQSFSNRNGSMNINSQGVELLTAAQLRTLKDREVIDLPVGLQPFRGRMFEPSNHKNYKYIDRNSELFEPYSFDQDKVDFFGRKNTETRYQIIEEKDEAGNVVDNEKTVEEDFDEVNKAEYQLTKDYEGNVDAQGREIMPAPMDLKREDDMPLEEQLDAKSLSDIEKITETLYEYNNGLDEIYTVYKAVRKDSLRRRKVV